MAGIVVVVAWRYIWLRYSCDVCWYGRVYVLWLAVVVVHECSCGSNGIEVVVVVVVVCVVWVVMVMG